MRVCREVKAIVTLRIAQYSICIRQEYLEEGATVVLARARDRIASEIEEKPQLDRLYISTTSSKAIVPRTIVLLFLLCTVLKSLSLRDCWYRHSCPLATSKRVDCGVVIKARPCVIICTTVVSREQAAILSEQAQWDCNQIGM